MDSSSTSCSALAGDTSSVMDVDDKPESTAPPATSVKGIHSLDEMASGEESSEEILPKKKIKITNTLQNEPDHGRSLQKPFDIIYLASTDHKEHFATVHRPKGLWQDGSNNTQRLEHSSCSEDVISNEKFRNSDTQWKPHAYKDYRCYYPDWRIQPDPSLTASNYWKFVFKEFNEQFAKEYDIEPADLPRDWGKITKEQALESLEEVFNMK
ncbi:hypothetical protein KIL84_006738 [Mauremys mutica]|uniref:Uncharacterized protein n=1 Tax=Mauremys mutica TaxID=74926 RepID=A0A9D4AWF4_9SAUR|nr:hypothetical protein KIL84_006738 [Mauremys mutica]